MASVGQAARVLSRGRKHAGRVFYDTAAKVRGQLSDKECQHTVRFTREIRLAREPLSPGEST